MNSFQLLLPFEQLSIPVVYNVAVVYKSFALILFAALLAVYNSKHNSKSLNTTTWVVAIASLFAIPILENSYLNVYAATALSVCFISLFGRAERMNSGWRSVVWSQMIAVSFFVIANIITNEGVCRISDYALYELLESRGNLLWLENSVKYVSITLLLLLSLGTTMRVLDRVAELVKGTRLPIWSAGISTVTALGALVALLPYYMFVESNYPFTLSFISTDIGLFGISVVLVMPVVHGLVVFMLKMVLEYLRSKYK